jgi:hypothetical protein
MEHGDEIRTIIHSDDWGMIQGGMKVLIVGPSILRSDGKDRNLVILDQGGSYVVLGGKRIGGAEDNLGPSGLQRANQVCGLCGHVEASGKTEPS